MNTSTLLCNCDKVTFGKYWTCVSVFFSELKYWKCLKFHCLAEPIMADVIGEANTSMEHKIHELTPNSECCCYGCFLRDLCYD